MVLMRKTELPVGISIKCEDDYRSDPVFGIIRNDCHDKCYICEDKYPTSINVEHLRAHKNDDVKKYDWNNLFLSCTHCNKAKNKHYDDIIDCSKIDPEEYITVGIRLFPNILISIAPIHPDECTMSTIALLERVFNEERPAILSAECENLRRRVKDEMHSFMTLITYYESLDPDNQLKEPTKRKICDLISRKASFAAFKRQIVRETECLNAEFGQLLEDN